MLAPGRTPAAIIERVQLSVAAVLNEPDFKARHIDGRGFVHVASTPSAFARFIADDLAYKARLIKSAGIEPE